MATVAAIAVKRDNAILRIAAASNKIASELGVEALRLSLFNRDPEMLRAQQLTELAGFLEGIQAAITPEQELSDVEIKSRDTGSQKAARRQRSN